MMKTYDHLALKTEDYSISEGSYEAKLDFEALTLPSQMQPLLDQYKLKTILSALSWIFCYPTEVAHCLNWDVKNVLKANEELKHLVFWEEPKRVFNFGARKPEKQ
jgi:hypothetical protein